MAMSFAFFLAKNLHLSIGEEFCTFPSAVGLGAPQTIKKGGSTSYIVREVREVRERERDTER